MTFPDATYKHHNPQTKKPTQNKPPITAKQLLFFYQTKTSILFFRSLLNSFQTANQVKHEIAKILVKELSKNICRNFKKPTVTMFTHEIFF
jgi:hypothetical protein